MLMLRYILCRFQLTTRSLPQRFLVKKSSICFSLIILNTSLPGSLYWLHHTLCTKGYVMVSTQYSILTIQILCQLTSCSDDTTILQTLTQCLLFLWRHVSPNVSIQENIYCWCLCILTVTDYISCRFIQTVNCPNIT